MITLQHQTNPTNEAVPNVGTEKAVCIFQHLHSCIYAGRCNGKPKRGCNLDQVANIKV